MIMEGVLVDTDAVIAAVPWSHATSRRMQWSLGRRRAFCATVIHRT